MKYYVEREVYGKTIWFEVNDWNYKAWSGVFCLIPGERHD